MAAVFLTAEWKKLAMANYPIDAGALRPFLPARTTLDTWDGQAYVSLVGFQFREVRVRGLRIPLHTQFPEVNLRFYVRYQEEGEWKRGVVFIREIVPLPAVAFFANTIFHERYIAIPMRFVDTNDGTVLRAAYHWRFKSRWNGLSLKADPVARPLVAGSHEEFITEHFWGYSAHGENTVEYQVQHPRWDIYPVREYELDCDFGKLYGPAFAHLRQQKPQSVFLAEGSPVEVYSKRML
ncbi:DUF2071 domain-containing protein [Puia sp.]|uniref:YqjF family protein n=1 Tax=Puia sp. TaxID=2045100 RepID=UPI002F3FF69E